MAAAMATTRDSKREKISLNYDIFTKKCENYVCASEETAKNIKLFLKGLYSVVKETEEAEGLPSGETLPELIVDNFDEEQIWQELELQNEARVDSFVENIARLVAQKDKFEKPNTGLPSIKNGGLDDEGVSDSNDSDIGGEGDDFDDEEGDDDSNELSEGDEDDDLANDNDEYDEDDDLEEDDDDSDFNSQKKSKLKDSHKSKKAIKPSEVDDKFFKLSEMEEFLEREEQDQLPDGDDSEDSVDLFDDIPSDETDEEDSEGDADSETGKKNMHYADFFDAPDGESAGDSKSPAINESKPEKKKKKKVKFNFGDNDSDQDIGIEENKSGEESDSGDSDLEVPGKSEGKSPYEIRQERLQAKIKKLEEEALSEKPWQLRGEISSEKRPENALLEEALEFDLTHRPAPVVTEETTHRLEDIIKQRVKDKAWDDVERKEKPTEAPSEFKKKLVLDQEKSKLSLSQVYEQEYLKQVAAADPNTSDKPEEIPKEHVEIKALVDCLFRKLDALCNFHFTPKQIAPEVKIVTNIPAISMEEVAPIATSDATLLAPEEVKAKPKGEIMSQAEKTDTDRKRDRRLKKKNQRIKANEKQKREAAVEKLKPGLGNKYSKEKAIKLLEKVSKDSNVSLIENTNSSKAMKSSSAFFTQLQDEVTSQIKGKTHNLKRKGNSKHLSAKRLKL